MTSNKNKKKLHNPNLTEPEFQLSEKWFKYLINGS